MDVFEEAQKAGKIRAHGITCHSFAALEAAAASDWVQINQVRWNSRQSHMDADVKTAGALFEKMRRKGQGMIGMKVVGQGTLVQGEKALTPEDCYKFQIESGVVDAFVVGPIVGGAGLASLTRPDEAVTRAEAGMFACRAVGLKNASLQTAETQPPHCGRRVSPPASRDQSGRASVGGDGRCHRG